MSARDLALEVARASGLENAGLRRVELQGAEVATALRNAAPAVIELPDGTSIGLVRRGRRVHLLQDDHTTAPADLRALRARILGLTAERVRPLLPPLDDTLIEDALLRERVAHECVAHLWLVQSSPSTRFGRQLRDTGIFGRVAVLLVSHLAMTLCFAASWWLLGAGVLGGRMDTAFILAWALMLAMTVPLQLLTTWSEGVLAAGIGGLLKQRMLDRAIALDPDSVRSDGPGRFLGRVLEAEALETFALGAGMSGLLTLIELGAAVVVMTRASALAAIVLVAWTAVALLAGWRYARARTVWTQQRLTMTESLIESMAGQRTRAVLEGAARQGERDDVMLDAYASHSLRLDRAHARLMVMIPRGWLLAGILALLPLFWSTTSAPAALAIGVGGLLLGYQGFRRGAEGMTQLAGAAIAWREIAPILRGEDAPEAPAGVPLSGAGSLQASGVSFRFAGDDSPVIGQCSLEIREGGRALLEGKAGAGKSTFVSLLTGVRQAASGTILVGGVDRHAAGAEGWRRRIAAAPQFQDNHILSAPLAFNLLMSRNWPPSEEDLSEAAAVVRDLGLGPLLDRMPSGLWQVIGDTGWQLSQGEKSRVYVARALLQDAAVVVLDESFAALDPENYLRALDCVRRRARTLLLVGQR